MSEDQQAIKTINQSIQTTIENNSDAVNRWTVNTPGSWGYLAGQTVKTCRQVMLRPLGTQERRLLWHMLWLKLNELKHHKILNSRVCSQPKHPEG